MGKKKEGRVFKTGNGKWGYVLNRNSARYRKQGFDTREQAQAALDKVNTRAPRRKRTQFRFWTEQRLEYMRTVILPESSSMSQAIRNARTTWGNFDQDHFRKTFASRYGYAPIKCLGMKVGSLDNVDLDLPPSENPVLLRSKIKKLEKELDKAYKQSQVAVMVKSMLRGMVKTPYTPPDWVLEEADQDMVHGVPTLLLSDVHHAEVVHPVQVGDVNEYNIAVSRRRLGRVFGKTIFLLDKVLSNAKYPGIVLALAGDMMSGNIHEEIIRTNEVPIFDAIIDLADILTAGILELKRRFGKVFVPCVVGNHGRLDRKPKAKFGPQDNFDYMLYHYIAARFEKDKDVHIVVSDSFTYSYPVYHTRYLLTHGDQFRGGTGISGPILPWTLGEHRLRKQSQTAESWTKIPTEYDVLVFGHWHQYFPTRTFIVNGSVKGYDEFTKMKGYPFEPPQQALWLTNPKYGVTITMPVFAVEPKAAKKKPWVAVWNGGQ